MATASHHGGALVPGRSWVSRVFLCLADCALAGRGAANSAAALGSLTMAGLLT